MVDITMCDNQDCAIKLYCYRFMAIPSGFQSYAHFKPFAEADGWHCEHFIEIRSKIYNGRRKTMQKS